MICESFKLSYGLALRYSSIDRFVSTVGFDDGVSSWGVMFLYAVPVQEHKRNNNGGSNLTDFLVRIFIECNLTVCVTGTEP